MREFLLYLIQGIVDQPDRVTVTETDNNNQVTLEIKVAGEDIGKVIGKGGKIIKSLRNLLRVRAIKDNKLVNLRLLEE